MKTIFNIQYELVDDAILKERIKSLGSGISYFSKNWLVASDLTASQIYDKLSVGYDKARILVIEVNIKQYFGMMPPALWEWIDERKKEI